jgi:hypothetical protein
MIRLNEVIKFFGSGGNYELWPEGWGYDQTERDRVAVHKFGGTIETRDVGTILMRVVEIPPRESD